MSGLKARERASTAPSERALVVLSEIERDAGPLGGARDVEAARA